jgi:hypothetical protein
MTVTTVFALATLGGMTQIGLFLFLVTSPKVAKASTVAPPKVSVRVNVPTVSLTNVANVNDPL